MAGRGGGVGFSLMILLRWLTAVGYLRFWKYPGSEFSITFFSINYELKVCLMRPSVGPAFGGH